MNKLNMARFFKDAQRVIIKHSPEILTAIGTVGLVTTTVLAVKATPKALKLIEEKKEEEQVDTLTPVETVKATWKCYIPAAITGTASIACIIGASSVNSKRNAALATAYTLSEAARTEYREKVIETIGEKKEQAIRDQINKDRVENNPGNANNIIVTGKGRTRCLDSISGRHFESDIDQIKKIINELNRKLLVEDYISLNEFYDELGLEQIRIGDDLGWNIEKGLIDVDFSSQIDSDGTPCIVVDYTVAPQRDYWKFS